jgi:hypothetical protein
MGGNFPKGILIGQVIEVRQRDFDVFQEAVIRPTVDFGRLEVVMVITNFDPLEAIPEFEAMSSERRQIGGTSANDAGVDDLDATETDDSGIDLGDDPVVTP